jgi:hypothetical protein
MRNGGYRRDSGQFFQSLDSTTQKIRWPQLELPCANGTEDTFDFVARIVKLAMAYRD